MTLSRSLPLPAALLGALWPVTVPAAAHRQLTLWLTCLPQLQGWLAPEGGQLAGKAVCSSSALLLQAASSRLEVLMQVRVHSCCLIPPSA